MKFIKTVLRIKFYAALFAAGYLTHSCVTNDYRYRVRRTDQEHYLIDTVTNNAQEIQPEHFQLGNTEYRIRNLCHEHDLQQVLEKIEAEKETKK
ncbi:hypothetical protein J4208_01030 [Candidatus Woesearchaeota archaeon]|nr:hypothetical protein [Candidatus Woesearchaeota archaeon]